MNDRDAAIKADWLEIEAMRETVAAAPRAVIQATGLHWLEANGASLVLAPKMPDPWFNRVMGLGMQRAATQADVNDILATCNSAAGDSYWVHRNPQAQPAALDEWLIARGLQLANRRSWAKVARGREAPPTVPTSMQTRRAGVADFDAAANVVRTAFGMPASMTSWLAAIFSRPNWHVVVTEDRGTVVGTGALYIKDGTGWLGMGGVLEGYRGRHAHRSLMALRIELALDLGCELIVSETGEPIADEPNPSLANLHRCGFRTVASRLNYASARAS